MLHLLTFCSYYALTIKKLRFSNICSIHDRDIGLCYVAGLRRLTLFMEMLPFPLLIVRRQKRQKYFLYYILCHFLFFLINISLSLLGSNN